MMNPIKEFNLKILIPIFVIAAIAIFVCVNVWGFSQKTMIIMTISISLISAIAYIHISKIMGTWNKHIKQ